MSADRPYENHRVLLHTCCAPCSCSIIDQLLSEGALPDILFYNPNVHPLDEYLLRKAVVVKYSLKMGLKMIDMDYDPENWFDRVKGLEHEPERGKRCSLCFDMRLERAARYAHDNKYRFFATTNGIGRWKDMDQVNRSGRAAALPFSGLTFLDRNWRLKNSQAKAAQIIKKEQFYAQTYCGCTYSRKLQVSMKGSPAAFDKNYPS